MAFKVTVVSLNPGKLLCEILLGLLNSTETVASQDSFLTTPSLEELLFT